MFCEKCGEKKDNQDKFCKNCGFSEEVSVMNTKNNKYSRETANLKSNTQNKTTIMDKLVKMSIVIGVLIIALSIAYYLVIFLPEKESTKLEMQKNNLEKLEREATLNETLLNLCLSDAEKEYIRYAEINGTKKEDGTIWAQNDVWDRAEKNRKEAKDDCFAKYQKN